MFKKKITPIYFDYAASTPISPQSFEAMKPWLDGTFFGNASSIHVRGKHAKDAIESARDQIKTVIGATRESKLVFTSGGTESNTLAIRGAQRAGEVVLISQIEHSSLFNLAKNKKIYKQVHVQTNGIIDLDDLRKKLLEYKPRVLSIMLVNNEIGTVQPVKKIVEITRELSPQTLIHTDASQAFSYIPCNVESLDVDMMSLCSQKIYGPQGIGALYIKAGVELQPIFVGTQEGGLRAGTEPTALIMGFASAAAQTVKNRPAYIKTMKEHKEHLLSSLNGASVNYVLHGRDSLSRAINLSFPDCEYNSEGLVSFLNTKKVYLSSQAACMGAHAQDSHVQMAIVNQEKNTIRVSFGISTTKQDIDRFIKVIKEIC